VRVPAGLADRGNHRVERLPVAASDRDGHAVGGQRGGDDRADAVRATGHRRLDATGAHAVGGRRPAASYRGVAVASGVRERCTVVAMPPTAAVAPR